MLSEDIAKIEARLKDLQELIEVASFHQRKLQDYDNSLDRQKTQHNNFDLILKAMGE